jgi:adenylate cyclase
MYDVERELVESLARLAESAPEPWAAHHDYLADFPNVHRAITEARIFARHEEERERIADLAQLRADLVESAPVIRAQAAAAGAEGLELARRLDEHTALRRSIDSRLSELRPYFDGKHVVVGYTATALADMTPIPVNRRAPGMMLHANLLSAVLSKYSISRTPWYLRFFGALVLGLATTLVASVVHARIGVVLVLCTTIIYAMVAGYLLFYWSFIWAPLATPLASIFVPFFAVMTFRFTFLDRQRRQLVSALRQYTSPALARQMAEDEQLCRRAETREVSALFTDFRGFTGISERIGAERTQNLLNVSLGAISNEIIRHEGMINKFIGDAVFAFWNPVIYPQPDHAHRACRAALDLVTALARVCDDVGHEQGDTAFAELFVRVGVATGPAVVGPCGSQQKYDYTCIGDTVNVASRLEAANKFYRTQIIVADATRHAAADEFLFRPLGRVVVRGRQSDVGVFELIGRRIDAAPILLKRVDLFERAIAALTAGEIDPAHKLLTAHLQSDPEDATAKRFIDILSSDETRASPHPGVIELD